MKHFSDYIKSIRAGGHSAFSTGKALADLNISKNALRCGMHKLMKKGEIISPAKHLYIIIPPEYQSLGCLPASELIPILMQHWNLPYYVCLLSAADYHGASHQKPQILQVMTPKQLSPLTCGKVRIEFIYKKSFNETHTQKRTVKTGYLTLATPELTALELLMYSHQAGGLNHIATVLSELVEAIQLKPLVALLKEAKEKAAIQRLGYILEHIETMESEKQKDIANSLYQHLEKQNLNPVPLAPELPIKGQPRNHKWMIIENTTIESDL